MLISRKRILNGLLFGATLLSMVPCKASFSPFVDILVWDTSEEASSIWSNITTLPSDTVHDYQVQNINFDWGPGLRAGSLVVF